MRNSFALERLFGELKVLLLGIFAVMTITFAVLDASREANLNSTKAFRDLEVALNPLLSSIID